MSDQLSGSLQENLLTLLCFNDEAAPILANSLNPGLFENDVYKDIAIQAIDYFNSFKESPKDHISDLLETRLDDPKKEKIYTQVILALYDNQDNVNVKYVLESLHKFISDQNLKTSIIEAANAVKLGDTSEARNILTKASKQEITVFDPGTFFVDTNRSLRFLTDPAEPIPTGIAPLDAMKIGPTPGELMIVLAPPNRGKTFGMVHLGKTAVRSGYKVLHITLEMSEEKMSRRYIQGLFSFSTSKEEGRYAKFIKDEMGRFSSLDFKNITRPVIKSNEDSQSRKEIVDKIDKFKKRWKLYIKRFPTNGLNIAGLEAYLDAMELHLNFVPDLLIVDYADLMDINSNNLRIDTGIVYKNLRRIGVERNIAVVSASQTNKLAEDAKVITLKHLAEDYTKAATADTILAYCQTSAEQKLGLARLFLAKARDEERDQSILISQAYRFGQFCTDAILMNDNKYWDELKIYDKESTGGGTRRRQINFKKKPND